MKEAVLPPPIEGLEGLYTEVSENPLLFATIDWKFTRKQNYAIRERDNFTCQFPDGHGKCDGQLETHHVVPKALQELSGILVDNPMLAITLCHFHHQIPHTPNGRKSRFRTEKGTVIWNNKHDGKLFERIEENTQKAIKKGWVYPT